MAHTFPHTKPLSDEGLQEDYKTPAILLAIEHNMPEVHMPYLDYSWMHCCTQVKDSLSYCCTFCDLHSQAI